MEFSIRDHKQVRKSGAASTVGSRVARVRRSASAATAALVPIVLMLGAATGCSEFHLSTRNLEIHPNPAHPGETVIASLLLEMLPVQEYTLAVFIDGEEHLSFTEDQTPAVPLVVELGEATALIQAYGAGQHTVYVEVRTKDRSSRTADRAFELLDSAG